MHLLSFISKIHHVRLLSTNLMALCSQKFSVHMTKSNASTKHIVATIFNLNSSSEFWTKTKTKSKSNREISELDVFLTPSDIVIINIHSKI